MKEDFIRVKTKGYPTLEDLAAEYDITMQELVEFHNARCSVVDLLSISFPKYLESVYMPADNYLTRQDITLASTQLRLQSITSDKEYGVHIKYSPKQLQIHYKIKVNRNQQKVTLFKERVFINNKGVERVVEQMFEKMDKTMYPLELMTTSNGKIDSISNDTEIVKRWKEDTLPKLKQYYQSEVSDDIIKKVDKAFTAIGENRDLLDRNLFYKGRKSVEYEILYPKIAFAGSWFYEAIDSKEYPSLVGRQGLGIDINLSASPLVGTSIRWDILELVARKHPIAYALLKTVDILMDLLADDDSCFNLDFIVSGQIKAEVGFQHNMLAGFKDISAKGGASIQVKLELKLNLSSTKQILNYKAIAKLGFSAGASSGLGTNFSLGVDRKGVYMQTELIFEGILLEFSAMIVVELRKEKDNKKAEKVAGYKKEIEGKTTFAEWTGKTDKFYLKS